MGYGFRAGGGGWSRRGMRGVGMGVGGDTRRALYLSAEEEAGKAVPEATSFSQSSSSRNRHADVLTCADVC